METPLPFLHCVTSLSCYCDQRGLGKGLGGLGLNTFFQGLGYPVPASPGYYHNLCFTEEETGAQEVR